MNTKGNQFIALAFIVFSFLSVSARAEDTIDYQFVCSEKLRLIKNKAFKSGMCNIAGLLSARFYDDKSQAERINFCEDGVSDCQEKFTSPKFKKKLRKSIEKCQASVDLPAYTCSLSTDIISTCIDDIVAAFKSFGKYSCSKLVKKGKKVSEGEESASCNLIESTCPEIKKALDLFNP